MRIATWFDRIDPGTHRRIKGLRLVTAFGLTAVLATASWKADQFADQMLWKKRVSGE